MLGGRERSVFRLRLVDVLFEEVQVSIAFDSKRTSRLSAVQSQTASSLSILRQAPRGLFMALPPGSSSAT